MAGAAEKKGKGKGAAEPISMVALFVANGWMTPPPTAPGKAKRPSGPTRRAGRSKAG